MKLELKHLAPYLPYKVKILNGWGDIHTMNYTHLDDNGNNGVIFGIKPILRNLSDLTKEIEHNGEKFVPIDYFLGEDVDLVENAVQINDLSYLPYNIVQKLLEWNFDVFGLIEKGLAINYNDIELS